jgi:hypothetical protein
VECFKADGNRCIITSACGLRHVLASALEAYFWGPGFVRTARPCQAARGASACAVRCQPAPRQDRKAPPHNSVPPRPGAMTMSSVGR